MEKNKLLITINTNGKIKSLQAPKGRRLKGLISDAGIDYSLPCGGLGRCGKCKVRFISGTPAPNSLDKSFLTDKELQDGVRLLCRCVLDCDAEIDLGDYADKEEEIEVSKPFLKTNPQRRLKREEIVSWGICIDIGTTTLEAMLVGVNANKKRDIFEWVSGINHQRSFGADVISRIAAAGEGCAKDLRKCIQSDLAEIIEGLIVGNEVLRLDYICITGNTTMLHLLRGYDVSGLGKYPYKTVSLDAENISAEELFEDADRKDPIGALAGTKVILVPGISAFVGADIVSGLFSINVTHREYSELFLDLGTNGEMAFWDGEKLYVTSTAVGPVFEAGGISCGVAAIPGAICRVSIDMHGSEPLVKIETIKDKEPIGICGTGVLEAVSELVRNKIVDETGLLTDKYFEDGFPLTGGEDPIRITQNDIRAVQLGKAALIAAQKELLQGRKPKFVEVSGGYGVGFMPDKIRHLGLFLSDEKHVRPVANAALAGCFYLLVDFLEDLQKGERSLKELTELAGSAQVVELVNKQDFAENYVESMNFDI